jgi:hypothetical protein
MCSWQVAVPAGAVRLAVDHAAAAAADALAAVVVEGDRLLVLLDELLVDVVEHLEEGHVVGDVVVVGPRSGRSSSGTTWRQTLSFRFSIFAMSTSAALVYL